MTVTALTRDLRGRLVEAIQDEPDVDTTHEVVWALAAVSDGPLEVREDYGGLPSYEWTDVERVDAALSAYGLK